MTTHFHRVFLVGTVCALAGSAFAQNGNMGGMGGGGNRPDFNQNQGQNQNSSAQREAMRAQMREQQIRSTLSSSGFTDTNIQDPIVDLAKQEMGEAATLLPKINALRSAFGISTGTNRNNQRSNANTNANFRNMNAMNTGFGVATFSNASTNTNTNVADDKTIADLLADYRDAVATSQKGREAAISDLDKTISFSTNPKLEALLTMLGIIGDETGFVSGLAGQAQLPGASNSGGGPGGQGGMGGPGGMNGQGQGGMNGGMGGPGGMNGNMGGGQFPPMPPDGN